MKRRTASLGVLSHEFRPMAYRCEFGGTAQPGRLELRESRSTGRVASMRRERSGEIVLGEIRWQLLSVRDIAGSALPVAVPIGYLIERDGRSIAAVELNGTEPVVLIAAGSSGADRQAAVLAALSLALLWDPKETGLSD
jgi:hypothetical protein